MDGDRATAERVVERLRFGLPPRDRAGALTTGLCEQVRRVERSLCSGSAASDHAMVVKADHGAGASHMLQVAREMALDAGYAASLVVAGPPGGVRFNRVDTLFGAICHGVEVDRSGRRGIGALFDAVAGLSAAPASPEPALLALGRPRAAGPRAARRDADRPEMGGRSPVRAAGPRTGAERIGQRLGALSSHGRWDYSEYLRSPAMYVALRAWAAGADREARLVVESWLADPASYRDRGTWLYETLIYRLRDAFRDPRPAWKFHAEGTLALHETGRTQVWDAIADLGSIARAAGLRGIVFLFDDVEDGILGLGRADHRQGALRNLLRFFEDAPAPHGVRAGAGESQSPIRSLFAVTSDFGARCRAQALGRDEDEVDWARIEALSSLRLPPMALEEFFDLAGRIRLTHGLAYGWDAAGALPDGALAELAGRLWKAPAPERVRWGIQRVVQALDERLQARD